MNRRRACRWPPFRTLAIVGSAAWLGSYVWALQCMHAFSATECVYLESQGGALSYRYVQDQTGNAPRADVQYLPQTFEPMGWPSVSFQFLGDRLIPGYFVKSPVVLQRGLRLPSDFVPLQPRPLRTSELILPWWLLTIPYLFEIVTNGVRRYFDGRTIGRCRRCGYDLRATPDRCPECGTEVGKPAATAGVRPGGAAPQ